MPDEDRPSVSEHDWRAMPRLGLGARLLLAQVVVAVLVLLVAWLGRQQVGAVQNRLLRVYSHHVLPLTRLGEVADLFAIDFVDAVHKVSDGSLPPAEGARVLERVDRDAATKMYEADTLMAGSQERRALSALQPLVVQARQSASEAVALMRAGDVAGLRTWRATQLYRRVDPLTARLHAVVAEDTEAAHDEIVLLERTLRLTASRSTLALGLAGVFSILVGLYVASRFLASLRRIDTVVRAAAGGDLTRRVQLAGHDEASAMASNVDRMIDAIEHSQHALAEQANRLARSEAEARAASAAKSSFLSNVSHELRTPLNVILGYTELLRRDAGLTEEHQRGLFRVHEAGQHLLGLIDDVLGIAKMEAAVVGIQLSPFDPAALLDDVARMLRTRAKGKAIALDTQTIGKVPAAVMGDRRRLLQVLLNLGGNAVKFTSQGEVGISMQWNDERLAFAVVDSGPGISEADQAILFQTFSQGEHGRSSGEGTGLGLHISQSLVRLMGGEITVESRVGHGARFAF